MKEIKLIKIDCPICGINTPYDIKYEANFKLDSLDFAAKKTSKHMYFRNVKCKKCNHTKCTIHKSNYARDYNLCHQRESPAANILFHKVKFGVRYAFTIVF